jgi:trehalose 6-phosphate phosphatase
MAGSVAHREAKGPKAPTGSELSRMERLFTPRGEAALEAVMRLDPVLAFDFDGTLAPIVDHPDDARVPVEIAQCLAELAQRHPVAIISGRSVGDVRARLGFAPRFVIGNHGAEDESSRLPGDARDALDALRARIVAAGPALVGAGVTVEDKRYSLALHYRLAPDAALARAAIAALLDGLPRGLDSFGGKCVVNVVAAGLPDKGDALAAIVRRSGAGAACFVGDDVNDEAVFRRASAPWLTIRIGVDDPGSQAMFFLDDIAELAVVLRRMRSLSSLA